METQWKGETEAWKDKGRETQSKEDTEKETQCKGKTWTLNKKRKGDRGMTRI